MKKRKASNERLYVFFPGLHRIPENVAPKVLNRSHSFTADVEIPKGGADGVIVCHGSSVGGYALFVANKKLHYVYSYRDRFAGPKQFLVSSEEEIPEGRVELRFECEAARLESKDARQRVELYIDRRLVGAGEIPVTPLTLDRGASFTCGRSSPFPVSDAFSGEFLFTGTLRRLIVNVSGSDRAKDDDERVSVARQ